MHFKSLVALGTMLSGAYVFTADCGAYGSCPGSSASSRNQLYAARQHVCGDTNKYQAKGEYRAAGGGILRWPGQFPQQMCWDRFDEILNQCHPEGLGVKNHGGHWSLNGVYYSVYGCG